MGQRNCKRVYEIALSYHFATSLCACSLKKLLHLQKCISEECTDIERKCPRRYSFYLFKTKRQAGCSDELIYHLQLIDFLRVIETFWNYLKLMKMQWKCIYRQYFWNSGSRTGKSDDRDSNLFESLILPYQQCFIYINAYISRIKKWKRDKKEKKWKIRVKLGWKISR